MSLTACSSRARSGSFLKRPLTSLTVWLVTQSACWGAPVFLSCSFLFLLEASSFVAGLWLSAKPSLSLS